MKTTFKLMATVSVASVLLSSQAFAGNSLGQHRLAERNEAYFKQNGTAAASNWTPAAALYEASSPQQRMGQRNADYFAGKTNDVGSQPTAAKPITHPKKH